MPIPAHFCAAGLLLSVLASFASAQQSSGVLNDAPVLIPPEVMWPAAQATHCDGPPPWHFDLLLGLPSGIRAQRNLFGSPWMIEGFAGLELIIPTAGLGFRRQCVLLQGQSNALLVNPGLDVYVAPVPQTGGGRDLFPSWGLGVLGAADVDVIWQRSFSDGAEGKFGVKIGAAVGGGKGHRGSLALPVVALFLGWGF